MNDRARVAEECGRKNECDSKKECDFDKKTPSRFGTKILATDIEERRLRTAGRAAVIAIEREDLEIAIYNGQSVSGSWAATMVASPIVVCFRVRFHRLLTFFL